MRKIKRNDEIYLCMAGKGQRQARLKLLKVVDDRRF